MSYKMQLDDTVAVAVVLNMKGDCVRLLPQWNMRLADDV